MGTIANYFFRGIGVMFGRSMRQILCSMDARPAITVMPIAFMLLFIYVCSGAILALEELFLAIINKKTEN
jgi:ABC-2 type transport system permease protein